ncbi:hypothetical protein BHM03_00055017, partial [Ensete ventricosum]
PPLLRRAPLLHAAATAFTGGRRPPVGEGTAAAYARLLPTRGHHLSAASARRLPLSHSGGLLLVRGCIVRLLFARDRRSAVVLPQPAFCSHTVAIRGRRCHALTLLHPHYAAAVAAPAQALTALYNWQPPCQGATTPTASVVALAGDKAHSRPCPGVAAPSGLLPLRATTNCRGKGCPRAGRSRSCPRVAALAGLLPLRAVAHCRGPGSQLPPCRRALAAIGHPLQVARPWPTAPIGSLAMASHLCM